MELRFNIDDKLIDRLQKRLQIDSAAAMGRDAFNLFDQAVAGIQGGQDAALVDPAGGRPIPLVTPMLDNLRYERDR